MSKEEKEEKDLMETFKALTAENRANLSALAHTTLVAQENTRKAIEDAENRKKSA